MHSQLAHLAIDQVAGDGDHVGLQGVDTLHNPAQVALLDGRPDMNVADLRHGKTMPGRRQALDRHIHPHHRRRTPRIEKAQQRDQPAQYRHSLG